MIKRQTFEQFLQEEHSKGYIGTDDDMPDAFDDWVVNLESENVIEYAEMYGDKIYNECLKSSQ